MGKHALLLAVALLLVSLTGGCGDGPSILQRPFARGAAGPSPTRQWTFMVYMDADGDLEEAGILNMNQMESVGSTDQVSIVVQFDRTPGFDPSNDDWTEARRYLITRDDDPEHISSPVLENLGEVDMGQPETLREFIAWAAARFPAERLVLVVWNHGAGWRTRAAAGTRGIIFDDTSDSFLTMAAFNQGLDAPSVSLDLIAMDASLMAMLEVAYEVRLRADYLAFSEESPPARGYPYDRILARLVAAPTIGAEELGRIFVEEFVAAYPGQAVTQSLVRTARLEELAGRVAALAVALQDVLPARQAALDQARADSQGYASRDYHDLFDFTARVQAAISDPEVQAAAAAVLTGIPAASGGPVVAEAHGPVGVENSHGLSIFLPEPGQSLAGYANLAFSQDFPQWHALLRQWLDGE
ncbi:MAG: hypothetical protein GX774_10320 [Armatimonadetes bacterium]|nr:hypothetical protein [Armatimonadota bacterium]